MMLLNREGLKFNNFIGILEKTIPPLAPN